MALPIITALRALRDPRLKESLLHTAQELAHRASIYGVARVSLSYLALKCHCCKQTIINHLKKLIALKILRKTVIWIKGNFCEVNTYAFLLSWDKRPAPRGSDTMTPKFPPRTEEKEKWGSLEEKKQMAARGLSFLTPGSALYAVVVEQQTSP